MGRVHENYLSALKTGQVNFDPPDGSYAGKASAKYLNGYFEKLAKYHINTFAGLESGQVVSWFGEDVSPCIHLCRLLAHETLHHGHLKDLCTIQDFLTVVNFVFFRRSE